MLRVCTLLNHTERTTETKNKRSYIKDSQVIKTRDTEIIVLHIISARTLILSFFFSPPYFTQHPALSSSHPLPGCSLLLFIPSTQSLYRRLSGDHRNTVAKGFRVTLVEVCTETLGFFFFFLSLSSIFFFFFFFLM